MCPRKKFGDWEMKLFIVINSKFHYIRGCPMMSFCRLWYCLLKIFFHSILDLMIFAYDWFDIFQQLLWCAHRWFARPEKEECRMTWNYNHKVMFTSFTCSMELWGFYKKYFQVVLVVSNCPKMPLINFPSIYHKKPFQAILLSYQVSPEGVFYGSLLR